MKTSCPTTTLLPPYPSRWCPHTMSLPENEDDLIAMCHWIDKYLDGLWSSYLTYCEFVMKPESIKIFAIIFCEMDFFEIIKERIVNKISTQDLHKDVL